MLLPWPEVGQRCGPVAGPDSSVTISAASISAFSSASGLTPAPAPAPPSKHLQPSKYGCWKINRDILFNETFNVYYIFMNLYIMLVSKKYVVTGHLILFHLVPSHDTLICEHWRGGASWHHATSLPWLPVTATLQATSLPSSLCRLSNHLNTKRKDAGASWHWQHPVFLIVGDTHPHKSSSGRIETPRLMLSPGCIKLKCLCVRKPSKYLGWVWFMAGHNLSKREQSRRLS